MSSQLDELKQVCDRIAVMVQGKVFKILSPHASDGGFALALSSEEGMPYEAVIAEAASDHHIAFLLLLVIMAASMQMDLIGFFNQSIVKGGGGGGLVMNGVLVLSLIPMLNEERG